MSRVLSLVCLLLASSISAHAYTLDGNLSDWGVTPMSDLIPDGATIDYVALDNRSPHGSVSGGEAYDIEAMYFDDDADYIYFALVSSYHQAHAYAGDLGLSLDGAAGSEYGVRIRGLGTSGSVQQREVREDPNWHHTRGMETWMYPFSGSRAGSAQLFYRDLGRLEGGFTRTYVLEARIDKSLFDALLNQGSYLDLHYALLCGNDYLNLRGDIDFGGGDDGGGHDIPEPSTSLLIAAGLMGLGCMRRKQIR